MLRQMLLVCTRSGLLYKHLSLLAVFLTTVMPVTYKYILSFKVSLSNMLMAKKCKST